MTIAACHISPEGVIFGTDSTSTLIRARPDGQRETYYLDHEQKLFEVGRRESASVGLATWGQGRIGDTSHRTIAALLAKQHETTPFPTMEALAQRLGAIVWDHLSKAYGAQLTRACELHQKVIDGQTLPEPEWEFLLSAFDIINGGYFVGGRVGTPDDCSAYEVKWSVAHVGAEVVPLAREAPNFRGVPNMMQRLVFGHDQDLPSSILQSGKWSGTPEELIAIMRSGTLITPHLLPLREAIDWIHTVIHTTIRAVKFAGWHSCGGPIEVAVVTTDRPFRWVCHKKLDSAIITAQDQAACES